MPNEGATFRDAAEPELDVAVERDATASIRLEAVAERLDADTALVFHGAVCRALAEDHLCPRCHAAANELRALVQDFADGHDSVEPRLHLVTPEVGLRIDADEPAVKAAPQAVGSRIV
jgi:broad specificity phosphatase PhoE